MKPRQNPAPAAEINLDSGGTKRGDARARKVARLAREILHAHSVAILEMKELPASLRRAMRRGPASVDR